MRLALALSILVILAWIALTLAYHTIASGLGESDEEYGLRDAAAFVGVPCGFALAFIWLGAVVVVVVRKAVRVSRGDAA